jgi:acyl carrier protein
MMTLEDALIARIALACGLDPTALTPNTRVDDIGLDSFSLVHILTGIECDCGLELRDDDISSLLEARSIGDYLCVLSTASERAA